MLSLGWIDRDFGSPFSIPPPPPPPPRPRSTISVRGGGGGGGASGGFTPSARYVPPPWLPQYIIPFEEHEESVESVEVADFALMHATSSEGAVVKALASGRVETMLDAKGRSSILLTGDDGTRYWYADLGGTTVTDGDRVRAGQVIARTKSGAPSMPEITPSARRPELTTGMREPTQEPKKPKLAQVVFVEPLSKAPEPPPKRYAVLIPIGEPPPLSPSALRAPIRAPASAIARTVMTAGLVAVLLYALVTFDPKPPPKSRTRRKRRR